MVREGGHGERQQGGGYQQSHQDLLQRTFASERVVGMCSFRSGRHETSAMSRSSARFHRLMYFHSPSKLFGSVIVYSICSVRPSLIMRTRSTMRIASVAGTPESIQW